MPIIAEIFDGFPTNRGISGDARARHFFSNAPLPSIASGDRLLLRLFNNSNLSASATIKVQAELDPTISHFSENSITLTPKQRNFILYSITQGVFDVPVEYQVSFSDIRESRGFQNKVVLNCDVFVNQPVDSVIGNWEVTFDVGRADVIVVFNTDHSVFWVGRDSPIRHNGSWGVREEMDIIVWQFSDAPGVMWQCPWPTAGMPQEGKIVNRGGEVGNTFSMEKILPDQ